MTHDSSILVTIKSLFNGDGFKKLDAATKKSAQSAQRATAALGSVTRAMGTLDGAAGKAAGAIGSVFSAVATGGVAGLAVAGVTAAFSALSKRIEDARHKAEEAAKKMREAFEKHLSNIKVSFSSDRSRLTADAAQANAAEAASTASRTGAFNASVQGIRQNAALASIGKSPEEQKKIALAAEVEVAKKTRAQNIANADASLRTATETAAAEQLKIGSLQDEAKSSAAAYDSRIAALKKKIAARERGTFARAQEVTSGGFFGTLLGWAQDGVRRLVGKSTADGSSSAKYGTSLADDRAELAKLKEQKKSEQARIAADIKASKLNLTNARTAITNATNAGSLARADKSVEIAEKKLAAEIEAQAKAAAKKAKAGEDAVKQMFAERDAAKVEARLARQKEDLDRRIVAAKEQAAAQAAAIAHVQGAVLGGASIPDLVRNDDAAERDAKNSTARARRNLLSKIATANRNGRDASKWQKMLDALDGKNAAQNRVDKLQAQRDALQKKAVNELTAIKESLKKMGL
jgi:hypothetical protein